MIPPDLEPEDRLQYLYDLIVAIVGLIIALAIFKYVL